METLTSLLINHQKLYHLSFWTCSTVSTSLTGLTNPLTRLSNTLDLIIHDANSNVIPRIKIGRLFSDHNIVLFDISTPCAVTKSAIRLYRKLKNINPVAFMEDVEKLCLEKPYYTMLQSTLDHHAPIKSRKMLQPSQSSLVQ